eukprot:CAMPEP_0115485378 /NCGR_PEP_ID=MMETSP0271-20121206/59884_1 /TAXON_ID=71861 /ORGANISM="Scrippsiella trochoidea, Strain CCMP3099" /LENGTH=334 /DNA_ID=CAMNT_0002913345 /DNA_START=58 /DNA_END=1063 /DNA_ORIENTATION=-
MARRGPRGAADAVWLESKARSRLPVITLSYVPIQVMLRRGPRAAAPLVFAAALGLLAAPAFLPSLWGSPASSRGASLPEALRYRPLTPANEPSEPAATFSSMGVAVRALAVMAAVLIAVAAPQASYADDEVSEDPQPAKKSLSKRRQKARRMPFLKQKVEYNDAEKFEEPEKQATLAQSRAEVLESAAEQAQKKALEAERAAAERAKAAELFSGLDTQRKTEETKKEEESLKREEQRAQVLQQIEQRKTEGEDVPKAQLFFKKFFLQQQEERKAEVVQDRKKDEAREQVKAALEKRKADALKAAEEADAIAKRIEELAKQAREQAEAAKLAAAE